MNQELIIELDDRMPERIYESVPPVQSIAYWGQRKLLFSEIQFLTNVSSYNVPLNQCVLVYIGAAGGAHIPFLAKLFPQLRMILYDPGRLSSTKSSNGMLLLVNNMVIL